MSQLGDALRSAALVAEDEKKNEDRQRQRDIIHPALTKEPVKHSFREMILAAGFNMPPATQNRPQKRHKRSEGEHTKRGASKVDQPNILQEERTTMGTQNQTESNVNNGHKGVTAQESFASAVGGQMGDEAATLMSKGIVMYHAIDTGKFAVKAAIGVGFVAASCAVVKAFFFRSAAAPATL